MSIRVCRELKANKVSTVSLLNNPQAFSLVATWTNLTFWLCAPMLQEERFQLDMSPCLRVDPLRLIIPSAEEESQHRICCVVSFVSSGTASKLQQPVPLLSQGHAFTSSRECSNQLSSTTAECDRRLFSARHGDRVPTVCLATMTQSHSR